MLFQAKVTKKKQTMLSYVSSTIVSREINKKDSASKRHKRENKDNSFILDSLARAKSRKGRKDTVVSKVVSF